jgi:hypothetical protein
MSMSKLAAAGEPCSWLSVVNSSLPDQGSRSGRCQELLYEHCSEAAALHQLLHDTPGVLLLLLLLRRGLLKRRSEQMQQPNAPSSAPNRQLQKLQQGNLLLLHHHQQQQQQADLPQAQLAGLSQQQQQQQQVRALRVMLVLLLGSLELQSITLWRRLQGYCAEVCDTAAVVNTKSNMLHLLYCDCTLQVPLFLFM